MSDPQSAESQPAAQQPAAAQQPDAPQRPSHPAPPPSRRGVAPWLVWLVAAIIAIVFGLGAGWFGSRIGGSTASSPVATTTPVVGGSSGGSCNAVQVADAVLPTIVTIGVSSPNGNGSGSGEVIRKDGYIVTNNHVISSAANGGDITVIFSNGHSERAKLIGRDPTSDIAVLKVAAPSDLPVINLGNSEDVVVGQPVVALGAPLGLSSSVTAGIVSALGRNVPVPADEGQSTILAGAMQTDAAINPGNSGGALVNCRGDLIGVNTAIATVPNEEGVGGGGSVGIGFAVPVNLASRIANDLIANGKVAYPVFGAQIAPIPEAVAQRWGITDGLYVQTVDAGGSAAAAGIQPGDIITEINGHAATSPDVLTFMLLTHKAGDNVQFTYVRDGTEHTVTVTLVG